MLPFLYLNFIGGFMKKIIIIFTFILLVFAQDKLFTVDDVVLNSFRTLRPTSLSNIQWIPDSKSVSFIAENGKELIKQNIKKEDKITILTLDELNEKIKSLGSAELKSIPRIKWANEISFNFSSGNSTFLYNLKSKEIKLLSKIIDEAGNVTIAPEKNYIAYTKENNLYISLEPEKENAVTSETSKNIINGQSVHRSEFGINGGIFWSPKANYLAYYRMDETMVQDYPIIDFNSVPAKSNNIKYPMAGSKSHHVTVGVYNISNGKTVFLKTGEPLEQFLTCVTWSPDEKYIFVAHLNREQNHMKLIKYDALTGEQIKVLFEEQDKEFVEPDEKLVFLPGKNDQFLWYSERDGFKHLYLYDIEGNLLKQVTSGNWVVLDINEFINSNELFITATKDSPAERNLYKVNIKNLKIERVTLTEGLHSVQINKDEELILDSYNNLSTPNIVQVTDFKGKVITKLHEAQNPLKDYKLPERKLITIKTENNTDLFCRLVLPVDFNPAKKYPVIFYVYGGPHSQYALNQFPLGRYDLWEMMMAQKGYVVFYVDNRGTDNRGTEFEQTTHRRLGTKEIEDQLAGRKYFLEQGYVDSTRFGVWGWSYGGFMTTSLMTRTNAFKVGVAGGAVIDWNLYEIMYTERYMDTPQENPEGYKKANLLNYVENLKNKKLLLVHGTSDDTVVWQHSILFAKKAANLNVPLDYYPYPGHGHGVGGKDALQLYYKITDYFLNNL